MILATRKGELVNTAFVSKQSKISLKVIEAHTSVLVPLLILPILPFWTTLKVSMCIVAVLVLLERKGWTVMYAYKRIRRFFAGPYRTKSTKRKMARLAKY
ncbi:hypothetical protein D3C77_624050 [compost metagenome]